MNEIMFNIGLKCPTPKRLANGQRNVSGRQFNDTVTFSCNLGFTLVGSSLRRCRGSGNWDGVHPICGSICILCYKSL